MLRHIYLLLFVALVSSTSQSFELEGRWLTESNSELRFYKVDDTYIANTRIDYVTAEGEKTGRGIDYYYSFTQGNLNNYQGSLNTYDSFFGCRLDNGASKLIVLNNDRIRLVVNKITYRVDSYYNKNSEVRGQWKTLYCNDSLGHSFPCDQQWIQNPSAPFKKECVITHRFSLARDLIRLKGQN